MPDGRIVGRAANSHNFVIADQYVSSRIIFTSSGQSGVIQTTSMAGMSAFSLALIVAAICALAAGVLVLCGGKRKEPN
jgi:uncharacterized membrane protein YphA (DoxX/SURF4 family)